MKCKVIVCTLGLVVFTMALSAQSAQCNISLAPGSSVTIDQGNPVAGLKGGSQKKDAGGDFTNVHIDYAEGGSSDVTMPSSFTPHFDSVTFEPPTMTGISIDKVRYQTIGNGFNFHIEGTSDGQKRHLNFQVQIWETKGLVKIQPSEREYVLKFDGHGANVRYDDGQEIALNDLRADLGNDQFARAALVSVTTELRSRIDSIDRPLLVTAITATSLACTRQFFDGGSILPVPHTEVTVCGKAKITITFDDGSQVILIQLQGCSGFSIGPGGSILVEGLK